MSDNPMLKRAGGKVAALHESDRRLRAKAVAARQREKDLTALEDEARTARRKRLGVTPGTVI
ncbi:hypothetical protein BHE97_15280 [Aeromicrobium sp. PE09-221]|uniref:hypothetical protein n=1 Tax=Aeromicrobium sp. PE09-221 TaxID=1898043 RepID=UPI000B3EC5A8|nr:hypothetical protein [Aeromicrobium sp. PE09-221]OUZ07751.1 hypothetical protein BHE97_15280 [Aeromicrobium sp. PE09-221]